MEYEYDKIIVDLLNRIVILKDKVAKIESAAAGVQSQEGALPAGSREYRFLSDYLRAGNQDCMKLSYQEIEDILKFKLPESAFTHRAFWANTTTRLIALRGLSVNDMAVEVNLEMLYCSESHASP